MVGVPAARIIKMNPGLRLQPLHGTRDGVKPASRMGSSCGELATIDRTA